MESAKEYMHSECKFLEEIDLCNAADFFSRPCKHFPKMDVFRNYVSENGADIGSIAGDDSIAQGDVEIEVVDTPEAACD